MIDQQVPLPAAQALLAHASGQTTAIYAKTDLSQSHTLVDRRFQQINFRLAHGRDRRLQPLKREGGSVC